VKNWYFPIWHKLELYRTASGFMKKPISELETNIIDWACVVQFPELAADDGFNQTKIPFDITYLEDGTADFRVWDDEYGNLEI